MGKGKVYLIGAGPGDSGLLTVKGKEILEIADVVVYDALVSASVLALAPTKAKMINVGKRASNHLKPQEEINETLVAEYKENENAVVVRLKGGDPFLFGRGGEELELLAQENIPFEVVPGITSSIAVPAYNGIPVTHRDFCSSLHIITGHKKKGQSYDIDFDALVRTKGTLVFLMGVSALDDICKNLIKCGMDKDMPAAILQKGTVARQKKIIATVSTLKEEVERQGIETPAIIVVGKVCTLSDDFSWWEKQTLSGEKYLVPRPRELASTLSKKIRELGGEVVEIPTIETTVLDNEEIDDEFSDIESYQWIVLTSPTGVKIFWDKLQKNKIDLRKLHRQKFAVVGTGTKKALEEKGIMADLVPEIFDGEHLAKKMAELGLSGQKVLIPRAEKGRDQLVSILKENGALVKDLPMYRTDYNDFSYIPTDDIDWVFFTSSSSVEGFVRSKTCDQLENIKALCIGKQTEKTAKKYGMKTYVSETATIDSLVELAVKSK